MNQELPRLLVGDLVFIRVRAPLFRQIAAATGSWTNHVGIVIALEGEQAIVAESAIPWSRLTPLRRFAARSVGGRIAVARCAAPLSAEQERNLRRAAVARLGILYDLGFDLNSRRQFCSKFVRQIMQEALGVTLGETQDFAALRAARPDTPLAYWKFWYLGRIPWQRVTITPAAVLASPQLRIVFDGCLPHGGAARGRPAAVSAAIVR